jgi:hypothetical protein
MRLARLAHLAILALTLLVAPFTGEAQPILEEFRFEPLRLCLRDSFQWGVSYRGFPAAWPP